MTLQTPCTTPKNPIHLLSSNQLKKGLIMKNLLLLTIIFALSGCTIGDFKSRERFYEKSTISHICEEDSTLCEDTSLVDD